MIDAMFSSGSYDLPVKFDAKATRGDLKRGIAGLLTSYIADLEANGASRDVVNAVTSFRRSCSYVLSNYLKGIHSNAFDNFTKGLGYLGIENSSLLSADLGDEVLYRGRVNQVLTDFGEDEMLHIPLNKRGIVTSQRYSFPGLPCLYLASSAYTCWMELGRPSFDEFQVAGLRPLNPAAKVIDLSRVPQQLGSIKDEPWFSVDEYLLYWPLMAVCSIKTDGKGNPFRPEYIFPQFFLEYIQRNKSEHVGIRYASIRCERQMEGDWHTFTNYVFPTSSDSASRTLDPKLTGLFKIIGNRSGKELQVLTALLQAEGSRNGTGATKTQLDGLRDRLGERSLLTSDGKQYPYATSMFGLIELALLCDNFDFEDEALQ